jgi:hypothetical protein
LRFGRVGLRRSGYSLDLGSLLGLELLRRPLCALVIGIGRGGEEFCFPVSRLRRIGSLCAPLLPLPLHSYPVDLEAARKRLNRGEEALLQANDKQPRGCLRPARRAGEAFLARRAVLIEEAGQHEIGRFFREAVDHEAHNLALRESALDLADVFLEAAHHHIFQRSLASHLDAACETAGVE